MDFFEKLEFNRLIKELDFIDSDLLYKSNLLKSVDTNFIQNVNTVLETFPELKRIIEEKSQKRFESISVPIIEQETNVEVIEEDEIITENKPTKLKSLYREIAKSTHPDLNSLENLKEVYLEAQKAYESNDLIQILSICEKLKINYDISSEEIDMIKNEISTKRGRLSFLESTYTWKWYQEQSDEGKKQIIFSYLQAQISK